MDLTNKIFNIILINMLQRLKGKCHIDDKTDQWKLFNLKNKKKKVFYKMDSASVICWTVSHGLINIHITGTPER